MSKVQTCKVSGQQFTVTDKDREFYKKMGVPIPKLCPLGRRRLRYAFNSMKMFWATCARTGKKILSYFHPELAPFPIYSNEAFWSDDWDPLEYGIPYDPTKDFFQHIKELTDVCPRLAANAKENENADYLMNGHKNKNCYMADETDFSRDCYYGYFVQSCRDTVDAYMVEECELCYEIVHCTNCYDLDFSANCHTCSNSKFLVNCRGCSDCLFSANLRNKKYCIFNVQYSKEEYEERKAQYDFSTQEFLNRYKKEFYEWLLTQPHPATYLTNTENCVGDHLIDCKDSFYAFDSFRSQNINYCSMLWNSHDCYDTDIYDGELLYNTMATGPNSYNTICDWRTWNSVNTAYSIDCHHCEDVFGCVSLRRKKYCILNKQYSKEEYFELRDKIIADMKSKGQWGEFFPAWLSPVAYNDTHAIVHHPLTKAEALEKGFKWRGEDNELQSVTEKNVLTCKTSSRPFKVIPQEINFYKKKGLPLPQECYFERYKRRVQEYGVRILWQRTCDKTGEQIWSSIPSERPEKVYSLDAYYNEIHSS